MSIVFLMHFLPKLCRAREQVHWHFIFVNYTLVFWFPVSGFALIRFTSRLLSYGINPSSSFYSNFPRLNKTTSDWLIWIFLLCAALSDGVCICHVFKYFYQIRCRIPVFSSWMSEYICQGSQETPVPPPPSPCCIWNNSCLQFPELCEESFQVIEAVLEKLYLSGLDMLHVNPNDPNTE